MFSYLFRKYFLLEIQNCIHTEVCSFKRLDLRLVQFRQYRLQPKEERLHDAVHGHASDELPRGPDHVETRVCDLWHF